MVDIEFQLGGIASEHSLHHDLVHKSGLGKLATLRMNESKIIKESQLEPVGGNRFNAVVADATSDSQDRGGEAVRCRNLTIWISALTTVIKCLCLL